MWSEIITAVICTAISGFVSWRVAKISAKAEISKLRETWAHERETAIDAEFDKMVSSISAYLTYASPENAIEASKAISTYRAKATAKLAPSIDTLSKLFEHPRQNYHQIKPVLNDIIEVKRIDGCLNRSRTNKPSQFKRLLQSIFPSANAD